MAEQIYYIETQDVAIWDGRNWIHYYGGGNNAFVVQDMTGDHPYIILPDKEEEDYYTGGEIKGDIAREGG